MHHSLQAIQKSSDKHWEILPNLFKQLENKVLSQKTDYFGLLVYLALGSSEVEADSNSLLLKSQFSIFDVKEVTKFGDCFAYLNHSLENWHRFAK